MPRTMRAAVLENQNEPLVISELEIPQCDVGQVLVQVHFSGICGAQLGEIEGRKGPDRFLPHLMGHEGGGVVLEVGPGVTQVKPGDHVVMHWRKGAGIESNPPRYRRGDGYVTAGWITTFNEMAIVSENRLTAIDEDVPLDVAALLGCAVTTALGVVANDAQLKSGQSIAVFGTGGVGLNIVQGASLVNADPIIAIDIHSEKLRVAREFGATDVIDASKADVREEVWRITDPRGMDVVVDTTGLGHQIEAAYEVTAPAGRTILVAQQHKDDKIGINTLAIQQGKVLMGSEGGQTDPNVDIPRLLKLYAKGKLTLDELITHRFPLTEINEALDTVRSGEAIRCVITMT